MMIRHENPWRRLNPKQDYQRLQLMRSQEFYLTDYFGFSFEKIQNFLKNLNARICLIKLASADTFSLNALPSVMKTTTYKSKQDAR